MCKLFNVEIFVPFILAIEDIILRRARAGSLLGVCANIVCLLSVMLQPYMPEVSRQIQEQIQVKQDECLWN